MIKKFFQQLFLMCFFALSVESSPQERNVKAIFLSDENSKSFFNEFIENRILEDYVAFIKIDSFLQGDEKLTFSGVILHKCEQFILEFDVQAARTLKFILSNNGIKWSNVGENFQTNKPFLEGDLYTPNDILLPFLRDTSIEYCGPKKICGRMTQQFLVHIPSHMINNEVMFAKISIDSAFLQALQIDYLDHNKNLIRRQRIASLQKTDNGWLPKTIEILDIKKHTRSKVTILDLNLNINLDQCYFSQEFLSKHSVLK